MACVPGYVPTPPAPPRPLKLLPIAITPDPTQHKHSIIRQCEIEAWPIFATWSSCELLPQVHGKVLFPVGHRHFRREGNEGEQEEHVNENRSTPCCHKMADVGPPGLGKLRIE